jgi:hypothetical protein
MKTRYYCALSLLLLLPLLSWGQSISLTDSSPYPACAGGVLSVSFTTSGTFGAGNQFSVQLTNNGGATYTDLPGSFTASPISCTLPSSLPEANTYNFRVVASNPRVVSNSRSSSLWIQRRPTARLLSHNGGEFPVNPYTPVQLGIEVTGGNSYTFTLTDSTKLIQYESYGGNTLNVSAAKTTTFQLATVRNTCGFGTASGSATLLVNPIPFVLTSPNGTPRVCVGTTTPIHFSTNVPLSPNTRFEAQLIESVSGGSSRAVSIPISGTSSPLQLQVPADYPFNTNGSTLVRVFARDAGLSAQQQVFMTASPRASLMTSALTPASSSTAFAGGEITLSFSSTMSVSQTWLLSDGTQVGFPAYDNLTTDRRQITYRVTKPTTVSIVGPIGGECITGVQYGNRAVAVAVRPGVQLLGLSKAVVCRGDTVTLSYTATEGYVMPQRLEVLYGGILTNATLVRPGEITFQAFSDGSVTPFVQLVDGSNRQPISARAPFALTVRTRPRFILNNYPTTLSQPGTVDLSGNLYSGGPTSLTLNTGQVVTVSGGFGSGHPTQTTYVRLPPVYVAASQSLSVVRLANECGVGQEPNFGRAEVTIERPTTVAGITLSGSWGGAFISDPICADVPRHLNVTLSGTFQPDNQFRLETIQSSSGAGSLIIKTETVTLATGASLRIPTPTQAGISYRLTATNPLTQSNTLSVPASSTAGATATLWPQAVDGQFQSESVRVAARGEPVPLSVNFSGIGPFSYTFTDGTTGRYDYQQTTVTIQPQQTATYRITRLIDGCGAVSMPRDSVRVQVVPTRLIVNSPGVVCMGTGQQLRFDWFGAPPTSATYTVEMTTDNGLTHRPVPTAGTGSPLSFTIPAELTLSIYAVRLVARLPDQSVLTSGRVNLGNGILTAPPSVTLTTEGPTVLFPNNPSSSVTLRTLTNGSREATVVLSDGRMQTAPGLFYSIRKPDTYSLISAVNRCGYGQVFGEIRIGNQAIISKLEAQKAVVCQTEVAILTYEAQGEFNTGNKFSAFLRDRSSGRQTLLGDVTALSGTLAVPPSASRPAGEYTFVMVSTAPSLTLTAGTLVVQAPLKLTMENEGIRIYPGEAVALWIYPNTAGPYAYTLTTGTTSQFTGNFVSNQSILTRPTQSTTYSLARAQNSCGAGQVAGTVSVTVLPASDVTVRAFSSDRLCGGNTALLTLQTSGTFAAQNRFTVEFSDSLGRNYQLIPTISSPTRLTVTIPTGLQTATRGHRFRVISTQPVHEGASTNYSFGVFQPPTGTLTGNTSIFKGDSTRLSVALTGTPPWQLTLTDLFGPRTFTTSQTPFTLTIRPDTTIGYRLTEVRNNQCGIGTATGTALITVSRLLATEPALPLQLRSWPNPTAGTLQLDGEVGGLAPVQVRIHTLLGTLVQSQTVQPTASRVRTQLDVSQLPTGTYLLTAEQDGRRSQFKVIKN